MKYALKFHYKDEIAPSGFKYLYRSVDDKETAERYAAQLNEIFGIDGFGEATVEEIPCSRRA